MQRADDWPLVGRQAELSQLVGAFDGGNGVVISGGAGVGETPLASECLEEARRAAVADEPAGGAFFGPRYITRGRPVRVPTAGQALNEHLAQRLWERSIELTGVVYAL